jgi:recombination protein RecT
MAEDKKNLANARNDIVNYIQRPDIAKKLAKAATKHLTPDRVIRMTLNAMQKTPRLRECTLESMLGAMMATTALGLEPNTPLGHAYLIPFRRRAKIGGQWQDIHEVQYQIGYKGFVALAHRSPSLILLTADAIHQNDEFESYLSSESQTGTFLKYAKALEDRGDLIGSFCFMRTAKGNFHADMATVLPVSEVYKIRSRSETYRSLTRNVEEAKNDSERQKAEAKLADTPWVLWEDDMAAKSAIKKHCKQVPLSPEMVAAATLDTLSDEGVLDLEALNDPEFARAAIEGEVEPTRGEETATETRQLAAPGGNDDAKPKGEDKPAGDDDGRKGHPDDPGPGGEDDEAGGTKTRPAARKAPPAKGAVTEDVFGAN